MPYALQRRHFITLAAAAPLPARAVAPPEPQDITSVDWIKPVGQPLVLDKYGGVVHAVGFSGDGRQVLAEADKTLFAFDAASGKAVGPPGESPLGLGSHALFAPGGTRLFIVKWGTVISSENGKRVVRAQGEVSSADWVAHKKDVLLPLTREATAFAVSHDGKRVALGLSDGRLQLLDAVAGGSVLGPVEVYQGIKVGPSQHIVDVSALAYSADDARIAFVGTDAAMRFLDARTGKALGAPVSAATLGATSLIEHIAFAPDGKHIVAASQDRGLYLLDALHAKPLGPRLQMSNKATALAISPDGKRVATGHFAGSLQLWNLN